MLSDFYPRPPGGGRLSGSPVQSNIDAISIHALRVEGDTFCKNTVADRRPISIHALRVEGDTNQADDAFKTALISIHALRVEGDPV